MSMGTQIPLPSCSSSSLVVTLRARACHRRSSGADSFGPLPPTEVVIDDVQVTNRISILISAFGVLASILLLAFAVREYHSGASTLWIGGGAVLLLGALYALVRDVRRPRPAPTT